MTERARPIAAAAVLCAGLQACVPVVDAPDEPPSSESYFCPSHGYLDCMPIVPIERRDFCSADYRSWILDNCPNVEIVY